MLPKKSTVLVAGALSAAFLLAGCGTVRESFPARTATEQLLISTATDNALATAQIDGVKDKVVFVDVSNLDSNDKPYVVQRIKDVLLTHGAKLAAAPGPDVAVVVQVASGALSIDRREFLLGTPPLPLPIPGVSQSLIIPEFAFFKLLRQHGRAKFLMCFVDPKTNAQLWTAPLLYGDARQSYLWLLLLGPFEWGNTWPKS